mmetsp:Transcript_57386/g.117492  ORF Transcript_57386/g.117492 Transcript_57386/m.117492 type:complete len:305 (-) Transcript_57386:9-923(-)
MMGPEEHGDALQRRERSRAWMVAAAVPVTFLLVAMVGRAAVQGHVTLLEQGATLQALDADSGDSAFANRITDQMQQLIKRAKKEKANADSEDAKGLALAEKAKRTCQISEHLHDTDDGLEKRARRQREASQSLEGHAAVLTDEADSQTQAYKGLQKKGEALHEQGVGLQAQASSLFMKANHTNATTHLPERKKLYAQAKEKKGAADKLLKAAATIFAKATLHKRNADSLQAEATKTTSAASAVMQLGERFEREAVSHRLKTMTYRSKCTMMRARAQAALRKAQDEAKNAAVLDKIVKPPTQHAK